jgi:Tfp pilus assembly protein PilZ
MGTVRPKWRDPRYRVEIAAELLLGDKQVLRSYTLNVSMRGAFIVTDDPPALRQLFRVRFMLPPNDQPVVLHCMAAHVVPPATNNRTAGVGIQFYGVGGVDGTRWQQFVRWIRTEHPETLEKPLVLLKQRPQPPQNTRLDPTFDGRIKLRFRSTEELRRLYQTNITRGALLLPTKGEVPEGTELDLSLVHPEESTFFPLHGVVRSNIMRDDFAGVSVELTDLTHDRMNSLYDFVHSDISISVDVTI